MTVFVIDEGCIQRVWPAGSGLGESERLDGKELMMTDARRLRAPRSWLRLACIASLICGLSAMQAAMAAAVVIWLGARAGHASHDTVAMIASTRPAIVSILAAMPPRITLQKGRANGDNSGPSDELKPRGVGIIMDAGGYIITNAHVVRGSTRTVVRLHDGRAVEATVVGIDARTDLAVLRIATTNSPLPIACFAERPPPAGTRVIAIGDPFGLEGSVSAGVISGGGRAFGDTDPIDYIQHDAAVNKGNSGGPLLDEAGCLVGMNSAIPDQTSANAGIGFAIPAAVVKRVFDAVRREGQPRRAWLGVGVQQIDRALAALIGADAQGLIVTQVEPQSAAATAGLAIGDLLIAIGDVQLARVRDLSRALLWLPPGTRVALRVLRGNKPVLLELTLGGRNEPIPSDTPVEEGSPEPDAPDPAQHAPLFGLALDAPTSPLAPEGMGPSFGARISSVMPGSPAADMGLKSGDIVLAVGRMAIRDVEQARQLLAAAAGRQIALLVMRPGDRRQYVILSYAPLQTGGGTPVIGGPY
jgi:serine protease Do